LNRDWELIEKITLVEQVPRLKAAEKKEQPKSLPLLIASRAGQERRHERIDQVLLFFLLQFQCLGKSHANRTIS
jgi:archaellum biogenesis protein FlaJ (TadC family)